jgi:choline dehydrogenase
MRYDCDFLVVGAGSAGCALAARLSEDPRMRVVLVEEGPDPAGRNSITREEAKWLAKPELFQFMQTSRLDRQYWSEPEPGLGGRRLFVPRGKLVGGTSTFIAGLAVRGNPQDYATWPSLGDTKWTFAENEPYFKKLEHNYRPHIDPNLHGFRGPLSVRDLPWISPATKAFLTAAEALGYARNPDFNGVEQAGFGRYQLYLDSSGTRINTANGYLTEDVRRRENLKILAEVAVLRIALEPVKGKLTAVGIVAAEVTQEHRRERIFMARREVIISCGAIDSPRLLMLSGIGPSRTLQDLNIRVYRDSPDVGSNLQDHVVLPISFRYADQTHAHKFIASGIDGGMFLEINPSSTVPDLQFVFNHALLGPPGEIQPNGYTLVPVLLHPRSRGFVALSAPFPYAPPVIRFGYLTDARDVASLRLGARRALTILAHKAFDQLRGEPLGSIPDADAPDADYEEFLRMGATSLFHPSGTCRMGSDSRAVVDPELRVQGVEQLRVVDASVIPEITSGNIHTPTVMIAERAARFLRN